jgi:hypothetical protein
MRKELIYKRIWLVGVKKQDDDDDDDDDDDYSQ